MTGLAGGFSPADPYYLYPTWNNITDTQPFLDPAGRTQVDPRLIGGESTAVIIVDGQSLMANNVNSAYTVAQSKNQQMNIRSGGIYVSKDPFIGTNTSGGLNSGNIGHLCSELGDLLITNARFVRVIWIPMAVGGASIAQLASTSTAPFLGNRIGAVARRIASVGLTATHVIFGQGETDTNLGTSQSAYAASLSTVIANYRAAGISCPFLVAKETWIGGTTSSAIQAAQASVVDNITVFAGADMDSLNATNRQADNTHLNATGRTAAAALWDAKIALHP